MVTVRHISLALMIGLFSLSDAAALPASPSERAEVFARCVGDLGALATFRRNHTGGDHKSPLRLKNTFDTLLEAVLPDALAYGLPQLQPERIRFQAWASHQTLLNDITYSTDTRRKDRARKASEARIADCTKLLLLNG